MCCAKTPPNSAKHGGKNPTGVLLVIPRLIQTRCWGEGCFLIKQRNNMEKHDLKVGDELAIKTGMGGNSWSIYKIQKITATGRIVLPYHTLNPDLSIRGRGRFGPYNAYLVTDEIRERVLRGDLLVKIQSTDIRALDIDQIQRICDIIDEAKE